MKFALVIKNSLFYTLASVMQGFLSFFLLPVYTRFLMPDDYAVLALVNSFTGILSSVITLQTQSGITRFVIKFLKNEERAKSYFSSMFILITLLLLTSCFIINIFGQRITGILFSSKDHIGYYPFFFIATWTLLPSLLVSSGTVLFLALEQGYNFFMVTFVQVLTNLCCGLYFVVVLKTGVVGVMWAQLISAVVGLIFLLWLVRGWLKLALVRFSQDIKDSVRYSLPMIPHILSIYIYMYSDRLILQRYVPLSDIGLYSMADTFAYILLAIVNSTTTSYGSYFLKLAEDSRTKAQEKTKRFIEVWWCLIAVVFTGYIVFAEHIVKIMTRPSFYPSIPLIPILAFAYVFRGLYCFSVNSIFHAEKTKFIPIITISAALLNVALNIIFIPRYGIYAAAWTTVLANVVTFLLAQFFSRKFFLVKLPWRSMLNVSFFVLIMFVISKVLVDILAGKLFIELFCKILLFAIFNIGVYFYLKRKTSFTFNVFWGEIKDMQKGKV